jgi:hypothetical protein
MDGKLIGLITDKSRMKVVTPPPRTLWQELRMLIVIIPMLLLGLVIPSLAMRWDRNDLLKLEEDRFKFSDEFVEEFRRFRNVEFVQEVLYKFPQLSPQVGWTEADYREGTWPTVMLYARTQHPVISLYHHFDFFRKRLLRASFIIFQVSLITLILLASYTQSTGPSGGSKIVMLGFTCGLLTLPPPDWLFELFKIHLVKQHSKVAAQDTRDEENDQSDYEVILHDSYMYLKMVFLFATFLIYAIAALLLFLFIWFAAVDFSTYEN